MLSRKFSEVVAKMKLIFIASLEVSGRRQASNREVRLTKPKGEARVSKMTMLGYDVMEYDGVVISRYMIGGNNKIQIVTPRNTSAITVMESRQIEIRIDPGFRHSTDDHYYPALFRRTQGSVILHLNTTTQCHFP